MTRPAALVPPPIASVSCTRRRAIAAPAERVFSLASPLGEYDWIDGWRCDLVFPPSGAMQEGCVFNERLSAPFLLGRPGRTTWVVTRHDPATLDVAFLVFVGGAALARLDVKGERLGANGCAFTWTFALTALSEREGTLVDRPRVEALVGFLSEALARYCETGALLRRDELLRARGFRHGTRLLRLLRWLRLA